MANLTTQEVERLNAMDSRTRQIGLGTHIKQAQDDIDTVETAEALNTTHRTSDGSDHTFIDQDVTSGSSPTFDGTNFTGVPIAGIDNPGIKSVSVALSTANILALDSTPIELVAAPGAGFFIEPVAFVVIATFVGTALDDAAADGNLRIKTGTSTRDIAICEADGVVDLASGTQVRRVLPGAPSTSDTQDVTPQNEAIVIDNDGAAFTDPGSADTTMTVRSYYRVLPLT